MQPDPSWNEADNEARIEALRNRGVSISSASRVFVAPDVPLAAIEPGAVLLNASLFGETTCVGAGSVIGREGHATLTETQVGRHVVVGAGSYSGSVLFDRVRVRGFAELRPGTVLEEEVELGHNVGLKNSFLTAYVVTGSCINLCDIYVTGGTSRANHTEVGSGVIHFNFSPKRDKFASQIGDPTGLLGRSEPIFLGGQSGLIAPLHLPFGTIIPAGTTVRRWPVADVDVAEPLVQKCILGTRFVAALQATYAWYTQARLASADSFEVLLVRGALRQLSAHIAWRTTELLRYLDRKLSGTACPTLYAEVGEATRTMLSTEAPPSDPPPAFLRQYLSLRSTRSHQQSIRDLAPDTAQRTEIWLRQMSEQLPPVVSRAAPQV